MKQFFITFFANLAALLFVFGGPMLLILILIVASFAATSQAKRGMISIERNSILVLDLSINVVDSPEHAESGDGLASALGGNSTKSMTLRSLTTALKQAARDERIKALFIQGSFQPDGFGSGYAALKELREAILDFQNTKDHKKVYAYVEGPTTRDYYVVSAASTIYMNPYGEMEMPGLAVVKTYFKGLFDKYGIDVQVTRVGKYKSAVEPFILTKMSDADREETQTLLQDLWGGVVTTVTGARKVDPIAFQQLVDTDGYITAPHAVQAHLVDEAIYFGDVLTKLGKISPASSYARLRLPFQQISIGDYIHAGRKPKLPGEKGGDKVVAVLYLEGEIVDGWGDVNNVGGDRFAAELRQLQRDDDVKSVVIRVNSPGGSAFASEVILNEIQALHAKKPVIISMGNYAASGGYWVTTSSDRIFAEPNTLTGSIGVFGMFMDIQKLGSDFGVTWDAAKTGKYADFSTISRPKTPEELELAQGRVNDLYEKFLTKVGDSRKMIPRATLETIAQGRVWSGSAALKLNLVDEMGGLSKSITYAAEKAKLSEYKVKEYPAKVSFYEGLALLLTNQEEPVTKAKPDLLTQQFLRVKNDFKTLQEFNDPLGAYARMPLGWDIR